MKRNLLVALLLITGVTLAQQTGDTSFHPAFDHPLYQSGFGPSVLLDEAHHNFHTVEGRYAPFVRVLRADGFRVQPNSEAFSKASLKSCDVLVVANALHESNVNSWQFPTPSAFTKEEMEAVVEWVNQGGSLFLIADHMPFGGAASDLAAKFGFFFTNGFAMQNNDLPDLFTFSNQRLVADSLTSNLKQVRTFTGQGFTCPEEARKLLQLDTNFTLLLPRVAWDFDHDCTRESASGLTQLAILNFGKGRVVMGGEAAMFTSQIAGDQKIGLTAPDALDNTELLRRLMGWLTWQ